MSSLAATQADGYYVPVEYFESGAYKKQSKNQWYARQQQQQQGGPSTSSSPPVVRFELPLSGTCVGCGHFVTRGTRYNASKTKAGKYHTSVIWEFRVSCRNCHEQEFVIRTDPQNQSFDYVSGITKQQRHLEENGDSSEEEREAILGQLENRAHGERKVLSEAEHFGALVESSTALYLEDASRNAAVRAHFRVERNDRRRQRREAKALGYREGISLLDPRVEDAVASKETTFGDGRAAERKSFQRARTSSIFNGQTKKSKPSRSGTKRRRSATLMPTIPPDRVGSLSSSTDAAPEIPVEIPKTKKKKILVVGSSSAASKIAIVGSALGALADYGSDSSS